jgi:NADP-dependent 3-hydroxy acid dehydrogenase YdfG
VVQSAGELFRLDGRVADVTGTSSGLGARFAAVPHRTGADPALTARWQERLERLADELVVRVGVVSEDLRQREFRAR